MSKKNRKEGVVLSRPSWAGVRYKDNQKMVALQCTDIFRFFPGYNSDFCDTKLYIAKWFAKEEEKEEDVLYDKDGWDMNYYKVQIFALGCSKSYIDGLISDKKKRIKIPQYREDLSFEEQLVFDKGLAALSEREKKSTKPTKLFTSSKSASSNLVVDKQAPSTSSSSSSKLDITKILEEKKARQSQDISDGVLSPAALKSSPVDLSHAPDTYKQLREEIVALKHDIKLKDSRIKVLNDKLRASRTVHADARDECKDKRELLKYRVEEIAKLKQQLIEFKNTPCANCGETPGAYNPDLADIKKSPQHNNAPVDLSPQKKRFKVDSMVVTPYKSSLDPEMKVQEEPEVTLTAYSGINDESNQYNEEDPPPSEDVGSDEEEDKLQTEPEMSQQSTEVPQLESEQLQSSTHKGTTSRKKLREEAESRPYNFCGPKSFIVEDSKTHLVNNHWMETRHWLNIQQEKKDSAFGLKAYTALYGSEGLKTRSWSGLLSPRNTDAACTQAISPEKKKTMLWLMEDRLRKQNFPEKLLPEHARKIVQAALTLKASNNRRNSKK